MNRFVYQEIWAEPMQHGCETVQHIGRGSGQGVSELQHNRGRSGTVHQPDARNLPAGPPSDPSRETRGCRTNGCALPACHQRANQHAQTGGTGHV
jgi:hypothetical protein